MWARPLPLAEALFLHEGRCNVTRLTRALSLLGGNVALNGKVSEERGRVVPNGGIVGIKCLQIRVNHKLSDIMRRQSAVVLAKII